MSSHILVADDERSIRLMLEAGLKLNGFRVTSVPTGSRALEVARSGGIDAVLSDIYMPDGGGLDLIKDLRQINPAIPIILMTAKGSVEVAVTAMDEGATDFIGKPFDVAAVVELLRRHLGARQEANSRTRVVEYRERYIAFRAGWPKRADGDGLQADRAGRAKRCYGADSG